jgi:hypothetical protein
MSKGKTDQRGARCCGICTRAKKTAFSIEAPKYVASWQMPTLSIQEKSAHLAYHLRVFKLIKNNNIYDVY